MATVRPSSPSDPGRQRACSSVSQAVIVAESAPTPSPVSRRSTSRPGSCGKSANSTAHTISSTTTAATTGRLPTWSLTCPASSRPTITPTPYAAKTSVTVNVPKPLRCS